jgi:cytochrome P450
MYALATHPEQWRHLSEDRSLLSSAVDEMLRWWTPVIHFRRTAAEDTEIAGQPVTAGDKVVVYFASANRDPRAFPDPDRFQIARPRNDHLAFGHGPHFCLGAHLARTQMEAIFAAVLDRFTSVELAGETTRLRSNFQNGLKRLPIRWSPR